MMLLGWGLLPVALTGQTPALPGAVTVETLPGGTELWLLPWPGAGGAALDVVFPPGAVTPPRVAARVDAHDACSGTSPVLRPGPDFQVLSLRGAVDAVLSCLAGVGLGEDARSAGGSTGDALPTVSASPGTMTSGAADGEAAVAAPSRPTAVGALLEALYGPGGLDGIEGDAEGPTHLVLVGDLDPREAGRRVASALGDAGSGGAPPTSAGEVHRPPVATEVLLIDLPGVPLAEVQVGELLLTGDHPDWPALVVARELLARRLTGPEGPGWGYVELLRLRGTGAFLAGTRLPPGRAGEAVAALVDALSMLRDRLATPEAVGAVVDSVAADFRSSTGTPEGAAGQLARVAALGLGPQALESYPERLAALDPEAVRRAVRTHLDPARLVIAAVGDAPALASALAPFGPVRRLEAPEPPASWPALQVDGRVLRPVVLGYRVMVGGREVGRAMRTVTPHPPDSIRLSSSAELGQGRVEQAALAVLPSLEFRAGTTTGPRGRSGSLQRTGDRLEGTLPGGVRVDVELPPGTVVADLLEPTLWAAELQEGGAWRVPVTTRDGTSVRWAGVRVTGSETVDVPAGAFPTWRVEVSGPESMTLWVLTEAPHLTVRMASPTGVILELVTREPGPTPRPEGGGEPPLRW